MLSAEGAITVKFIEYAMRAKEEDKLAMMRWQFRHGFSVNARCGTSVMSAVQSLKDCSVPTSNVWVESSACHIASNDEPAVATMFLKRVRIIMSCGYRRDPLPRRAASLPSTWLNQRRPRIT